MLDTDTVHYVVITKNQTSLQLAAMTRRHHKESNVLATTLQSFRNDAGRTQIGWKTGVSSPSIATNPEYNGSMSQENSRQPLPAGPRKNAPNVSAQVHHGRR